MPNPRERLISRGVGQTEELAKATAERQAEIVERHWAEDEDQRNYQTQAILSAMLRTSLMEMPLERQLEIILDQILSIPWLALESKGCIFLVEDDPEVLVMRVHRGTPEELTEMCGQVPFGRCVCGRAALSGDIEFIDCDDDRHESRFDGMLPHAHLCVPILLAGRVLGVINLYVKEGRSSNDGELEFLHAAADVLAGIVERARSEQALRKAHDELEIRVKERTAELTAANEELRIEVGERERAEKALSESEERYRRLVEHSPDAIAVHSEGIVTFVNKAAVRLLGANRAEQIVGKPLMGFVHPDYRDLVTGRVRQMRDEGRVVPVMEEKLVRLDGTAVDVEVAAIPIVFHGNPAIQVVVHNITGRKQAEENLKRSFEKLQKTLEGAIQAMALTLEMRDPYTAGHQRRVAQLASAIAVEMGLAPDQVAGIRIASVIHDIGKIAVPAEILSKPGRLTELEFKMIKTHAQIGYDVLKTIEFPWPVAQIVHQHHERIDGSGYPLGLSGEDILLEARILGVADVVEAMASHRPYRPSLGIDNALAEISRWRDILYDPSVVDACTRLFAQEKLKFD